MYIVPRTSTHVHCVHVLCTSIYYEYGGIPPYTMRVPRTRYLVPRTCTCVHTHTCIRAHVRLRCVCTCVFTVHVVSEKRVMMSGLTAVASSAVQTTPPKKVELTYLQYVYVLCTSYMYICTCTSHLIYIRTYVTIMERRMVLCTRVRGTSYYVLCTMYYVHRYIVHIVVHSA